MCLLLTHDPCPCDAADRQRVQDCLINVGVVDRALNHRDVCVRRMAITISAPTPTRTTQSALPHRSECRNENLQWKIQVAPPPCQTLRKGIGTLSTVRPDEAISPGVSGMSGFKNYRYPACDILKRSDQPPSRRPLPEQFPTDYVSE